MKRRLCQAAAVAAVLGVLVPATGYAKITPPCRVADYYDSTTGQWVIIPCTVIARPSPTASAAAVATTGGRPHSSARQAVSVPFTGGAAQ